MRSTSVENKEKYLRDGGSKDLTQDSHSSLTDTYISTGLVFKRLI